MPGSPPFTALGLGDIYFSRLFTELWLRGNDAVTKTDAYELVQGVSLQTAMKYVRQAIAEGYLEELDNPRDARSRLIRMTPGLREQFNGVIDRASEAFSGGRSSRRRERWRPGHVGATRLNDGSHLIDKARTSMVCVSGASLRSSSSSDRHTAAPTGLL